jgi:hypothetical protein
LAQTKSVNKNDSKKLSNPLSSFTGALINWSIETADISLVERQFGDARLNLIFAKAFEVNFRLLFFVFCFLEKQSIGNG